MLCKAFHISYVMGDPYNTQGQEIVEFAHFMYKIQLQKQKWKSFPHNSHLINKIHLAVYTINF